ncbi:hypothetical protein Tco_0336742 [Tanacetum coccineum]
MEPKDTLSSCSYSDEQDMQQMLKRAKILKGSCLNGLSALKSNFTRKLEQCITKSEFERAFSHIFGEDVDTFTRTFSQNMDTLEQKLTKETILVSNFQNAFRVLKTRFEKIFTSVLIKPSSLDGTYARKDFHAYTGMEPQLFKETIIKNFDFIEDYMLKTIILAQTIQKRLNERKLQIQECMVQKVKASDASSVEKYCSMIVLDKGSNQDLLSTLNARVRFTGYVDNEIQTRPKCVECDNERVALANLIANLKLDVDENKKIQKQLKKANASLTQELKECKSTLAETSRTLGESNSIRDSCLVALQNKQTELEKYMAFNDRTVDYDKLERKLNETLGLLAQKEIDIKEGLKLKAYEISVVKEKHDELVKQSLLTKSHYEGLVKEKTKVITDLKLKEEKDIDKMISMEKQLKFLNEIVYKRNQSIQTIHMLAPKGPTFNGRPTFANPMYLKKAQYEKPCLYEIPYDQSDPANRLVPDREETLTLEKESRSKLNKDLVRPYDYTKLNSLYEIFKPASQEYNEQLAHANEVRKKMWRKSFVKFKPNIFKNIGFLPVSKSISKSRQAYNVMTNNINHFRELVDQAWEKHSHNHFRALTALDMEVLIKTCLMPLAIKTQNDSFAFVHELKQEMHADLKYVESLEKEIDELESDKAEFSNMYDILLQECVSNDVMCSYLHSLSDLDAHAELQCLYVHKVKECECLAQKLSKQTETVSKEVYNELLQICKEKASNVFLKEREQYFEIQDLKAHLQDKNIAISEFKKLIEKNKGKGVDTNFEKQSILGKPPLQPIRNQPVSCDLTKPVTPHSWPQVRKLSFAKPYDVNAPGPSRNNPKHVSFHTPRESVGSNDMVHNYYPEEAKKKAQL